MFNRLTNSLLICALLIFSSSARASSCNPNESANVDIKIALLKEADCAKQAMRVAQTLMQASAQAEAMGETPRMCSNLHAALMQLNQYAKGEWRNEYQRVGAQVDEDFDAYLKRLMLTQCKQKITMFRHLANQGNPWAMYQLGQAHSKGLGVTQDDAAAQDWYKQAALNEYTDAYLALGALNTDGIAFPPKLTDAFEWYMKAAQQGNAQAQFIVAGQYRNGQGVARDLSQAEAWYKKSAQQNYPNAKTKLVEMVKAGEIKKSRFGW